MLSIKGINAFPMKQLLVSLLMLTLNISSVTYGQVNCWPVPIQPSNDPFTAPTVCLEEVCFISNDSQNMGHADYCGPGTMIENPHYLRFQGIGEPVHIYVESMGCIFDNPIEIAILDAIEWNNENVIACQTIQAGTGDTLTFANGVAGATYLLLIDVTPPDMCSFYIDAVGGVASAPLAGNVTQISGPSALCPGDDSLTLHIEGNVTNANGYVWNASWQVSEMMTTSPMLQIPVSDLPDGNQSICAYATNVCDVSSTVCFNFSVNPVYETHIDTSLCNGETFTYNGVLYDVHNSSGTEFYTNAEGCDSVVIISVLYPGPDTTMLTGGYCIQDSFSLTVNGTVYDQSNPSGEEILANALGCDSIVMIDLAFHAAGMYSDTIQLCFGDTLPAFGIPVYQDTSWTDTLFNASQFGCDSMNQFTLLVAPVQAETIAAEICAGDSLLIGGNVFRTSGTYEVALAATDGCDSILTIELAVLPPTSDTVNQAICMGDSLFFMGSILMDPGMYHFSAGQGQNGCDSTLIVELAVIPPTSDTVRQAICMGDSLLFMDSILMDPGIHHFFAGQGQNGCDSFVVVALEAQEGHAHYEAYQLCPGDSIIIGDTVLSAPGLYSLDAGQADNGCDSILTLEITTPPLLVPDTVFIDLCPGDSVTISVGNEEVIIDSEEIVLDTSIAIGFPCDSALVYLIVFSDTIILDSVEITPDDGTGSGRILPFISAPEMAFEWNTGHTGLAIEGLSEGTYQLTITDINGCSDTFTFEVPLSTGTQNIWQGSAPLLIQNPIEKGDPIRIQPDPLTGQVDLIRLYASDGRLVMEWIGPREAPSGTVRLLLPETSPGVHFLQIRQNTTWSMQKLVIL